MKTLSKFLTLFVIFSLFLSSCATIMSGGNARINFRSEPSEARVRVYDINGMVVYDSETPSFALLPKGKGFFQAETYRAVIEKEGYQKKEIYIEPSLDIGWYIIGNIIFMGWPGWLIIDPITGAMWNLNPTDINANLGK